jgi:predicted dienelactone hydrolase
VTASNRLVVPILVLVLSACAGNDGGLEPDGDPAGDPTGCAGYEERGGFEVGVTTLDLDGVPVEVWYPAAPGSTDGLTQDEYDMREWLPPAEAAKIPDSETPLFSYDAYRDVDVADGSFPLVLFSHGMGGYRMQSSVLMAHLASWGFVVAAPEHPERGLSILVETGAPTGDDGPQAMRDTRDLMVAESAVAGGRFEGRIDGSKIAVTGHSAGGAAVLEVATDDGIATWMTFASGGFGSSGGPEIPSFMMAGTNDGIASVDQIESAFDRQAADKRFLAIDGMGHLGFSDICAIGRDRGGVLQIAVDNGVEVPEILMVLGNDGCTEDDMAPETGWPIVAHYTTAHLKQVFGFNDEGVGLGDDAGACFGDRIAAYKHD